VFYYERNDNDVNVSLEFSAGIQAEMVDACCTTLQRRTEAEYICPAGFLRGWPVGVELVAGLHERPGIQQRHFLQAPKDVFVCSVLIYV